MPSGIADVRVGEDVLDSAQRAYIATLPELRVALQRSGAPPYEVVGTDGSISGFQAEMLMVLARTLGLRIRPVVVDDWPAVLRAVRNREADLVLTMAVTADRLREFEFTLGTTTIPVGVFARAGPAPARPPEVGRYALETEYASHEQLRRLYPQASVIPVANTTQALQQVHSGAADYYLGNLLETLSRTDLAALELKQVVDTGGLYHFAVRRDLAPLAAVLNRGLASLRTRSLAWPAVPAASLPTGVNVPLPLPLTQADVAQVAAHAIWRIGAVRGLALLNDVNAQGLHSGIAADYTDQVARRLGFGVELVPFDSVAAMLDALRAGRIDAVPLLTRTPERARDFSFSQPYLTMPYMLVARVDAPLYWSLASLRGRRLALALQHPLREVVARRYPEIQVVDASSGTVAMDMVARGDADAAVEVKLFANLHINGDTGNRLRTVSTVDELPATFHFATSRARAGLVPLLDRALADIAPAEHERLLRRWVAVDLAPPFPWRRHAPLIGVSLAALLALGTALVARNRRLAREAQRRQRAFEELDDIGRTVPGMVFRYVLDASGRIVRTFFSSGADAFLGVPLSAGSTVVQSLAPALDHGQRAALERAEAHAAATGEPFSFTGEFRHPELGRRWLHAEAVRSTTAERQRAWTGFVVDVTAQHRLQSALAQASRQRYVLLASASHELRAPTHTLALALRALQDSPSPERQAQSLTVAVDAVRTLSTLLDDVLDVARLDAQAVAIRPHDFDLRALVEQVRLTQVGPMAERGLRFDVQVADDAPATVCTDALRLRQVLTNLLDNAGKYTAQGSVSLAVHADRLVTGAAAVRFDVADSGSGIPAALQQRLYEPFPADAPPPVRPGERSTGLGLAVCQRLVQLMGGVIEVLSAPGRGTTVRVWVPCVHTVAADTRSLRAQGDLLLCEDDAVSRLLLASVLAGRGLACVQADNADDALTRWRAGGIRAVITDLRMPGSDGNALIETIRREEAASADRTAIIICSGNPPPVSLGPAPHDAYLSKPVDVDALFGTLATLGLLAP